MCTFLLFLNIPVFQRVLDKYSVQVIPKTDDVVCITCCVWNVEIFYIHDNTSMILKTKMFNVHLLWSFNVIRLHVMCSIAIFSSTKSWNFSRDILPKTLYMYIWTLWNAFSLCCIIDSFCPLPLMNFFAFLLTTLKYVKGIFLLSN